MKTPAELLQDAWSCRWKARGVIDPSGRLMWVICDSKRRPFALLPDGGDPLITDRVQKICKASVLANQRIAGLSNDQLVEIVPELAKVIRKNPSHLTSFKRNDLHEELLDFVWKHFFVIKVAKRNGDEE